LATDALIGAMMGPGDTVGSGYVLLHHVMGSIEGHQGAWAYPEGGMGGVSNAMAKSAIANGASIFTDQVASNIAAVETDFFRNMSLSRTWNRCCWETRVKCSGSD